MKYWAFISYSHKDTAIADWLHEKLETYRIPAQLVGTPSREGTVPARIMPIFRDRDELPTSSELGDNLQKCLEQSRYLIVICSPFAAQSRWVNEEVRAFKAARGRDQLIALIAGGVPNATDRGDSAQECFPEAMRFHLDEKDAPIRTEPIAADIRPNGDGRERAFLKIVAGLIGVGFDDLYQREKRRQTQRKMLLGAAAAAALLLLAGIYVSIAELGKSQKAMNKEMATVKQDAAVATTDYRDIHPKNRESEDRIRAAAARADKELDAFAQARLKNVPDLEYSHALEEASKAIVEVAEQAHTTEESIFAAEVQKPLRARLTSEINAYTAEMKRRTDAKIARAMEQMQQQQGKRQ